ncbi:MAG TPA: CPCC family cysteine-rich protein, partial [Sphingopyxis sp.]|nr:CPCC family cysteine-rich protein [Sphingopyxis sp.]
RPRRDRPYAEAGGVREGVTLHAAIGRHNVTTAKLFPCPCCKSLTLRDPGGFEICSVCWWEDDGQGDADADDVRGGPNGNMSLTQVRKKWQHHLAFEAQFVPKPKQAD